MSARSAAEARPASAAMRGSGRCCRTGHRWVMAVRRREVAARDVVSTQHPAVIRFLAAALAPVELRARRRGAAVCPGIAWSKQRHAAMPAAPLRPFGLSALPAPVEQGVANVGKFRLVIVKYFIRNDAKHCTIILIVSSKYIPLHRKTNCDVISNS